MKRSFVVAGAIEPYHVFPDHSYQTLHTIMLYLVTSCFLGAGVWYAVKEPILHRYVLPNTRDSGCHQLRKILAYLLLFYVIPGSLIIGSIVDATTGDDDSPGTLLKLAIIYEVGFSLCLLRRLSGEEDITSPIGNSNSKSNNKFLCFGRRFLFISLGIIYGATAASSQYDKIDYYGPVRVTNLKLYADRPEQEVQKDNPTYYYYYTLKETLEWGGGWGCPISSFKESTWCKYSHILDSKDYGSSSSDCKKRIECQGEPPADGLGECANSIQQQEALDFLIECASNVLNYTSGSTLAYETEVLEFSIFATIVNSPMTIFNHTRPPWLDDDYNSKTAWRTAAVNCEECKIIASVPPKDLTSIAHTAWLVGCLIVVLAVILLYCGSSIQQKVVGVSLESNLELSTIT